MCEKDCLLYMESDLILKIDRSITYAFFHNHCEVLISDLQSACVGLSVMFALNNLLCSIPIQNFVMLSGNSSLNVF